MRIIAWALVACALAVTIAIATTVAPPAPQRLDLAWVPPVSAYLVSPAIYRRGEDPKYRGVAMDCYGVPPMIEVHVTRAAITVFVSELDLVPVVVPHGREQADRVARYLRALRRDEWFVDRADLSVVAHGDVRYREVIAAMELADRAGFSGITYRTPGAAQFDPPESDATF